MSDTIAPTVRCATCSADVPSGFRFCGVCGTPLAPGTLTPASAVAAPVVREPESAERRPIAVMFCDLAGSTALAERLDPEDLRDVVRSYQAAAVGAIEAHGGHVAQYLGDGILVYFGFPKANEDDARRAVQAALSVTQAVKELGARLKSTRGIPLEMRVAIHNGLVVAGDMGAGRRTEQLALGSTPNVAARLQELAAPGTVVISDTTYRLVQGFFECEPLGARALKGRTETMLVYRVIRATSARSAFDVARARGLSPAVGRAAELAVLEHGLVDARAGEGRLILVHGEAGIGKSRLIDLFHGRAGDATEWNVARCSQYDQRSALQPITGMLAHLFGFEDTDSNTIKLQKLDDGLRARQLDTDEAVPLLGPMLSVVPDERYPPVHLSPPLQRMKLREILLALIVGGGDVARVLVVEDLHWADPSTLDLLAAVVAKIAATHLLVVCTSRPGFTPPWKEEPSTAVTALHLDRLSRADVARLVEAVAGGCPLQDQIIDQVIARTDGVPLFVEELTKMIIESGWIDEDGNQNMAATGDRLAIPTTIHDSLLARLDRVGPGKAIAQLGSVIGREFTWTMIHSVAVEDEPMLRRQLHDLVDAGLLFESGDPLSATYTFKHALVQDAAYESLLRSTRRRYHHAIAESFSQRFPQMRQAQPELLAHHFTEAGDTDEAVECWQAAGHRASSVGGTVESLGHYRRALELLGDQSASEERDRREMVIQTRLGDVLSSAQGYAAPEIQVAYARAAKLAEHIGASPDVFENLHGLFRYQYVRADLTAARTIAQQLQARAQSGDELENLEVGCCLGYVSWSEGRLDEALRHTEQALALDVATWGNIEHGSPAATTAAGARILHHRCVIRSALALAQAHLGDGDNAVRTIDEALVLARAAKIPFTEAYTLYNAGLVHLVRGDAPAVMRTSSELIALSMRHGYFFVTLASALLGWGMHATGDASQRAEGIAYIRRGHGEYLRAGARLSHPTNLALLAEALLANGETAEALSALTEAEAAASSTGEQVWLPELHRLYGEVARASGDVKSAREHYTMAASVARVQRNVAFEARANDALAGLSGGDDEHT